LREYYVSLKKIDWFMLLMRILFIFLLLVGIMGIS